MRLGARSARAVSGAEPSRVGAIGPRSMGLLSPRPTPGRCGEGRRASIRPLEVGRAEIGSSKGGAMEGSLTEGGMGACRDPAVAAVSLCPLLHGGSSLQDADTATKDSPLQPAPDAPVTRSTRRTDRACLWTLWGAACVVPTVHGCILLRFRVAPYPRSRFLSCLIRTSRKARRRRPGKRSHLVRPISLNVPHFVAHKHWRRN